MSDNELDNEGGLGEEAEENRGGGDTGQRTSAISPSLNDLLNDEDLGSVKAETKSAKRRRKTLAKLLAAEKERSSNEKEGSEITVSSRVEEQQKTIEALKEMNLSLQADFARLMENQKSNEGLSARPNRRASIGVNSQLNASNVIRSVVPVNESEKMKVLTCFSIMSVQRKMNDLGNQGIPTSLINYVSLNILEKILMWLTMGYGQEAGLESHMFESTEDLRNLSDGDLESIMMLICRPKEKGQLVNLMSEIKVFVSQQTLNRPMYLQLKTTFQAVLSYLHTYERVYKMASGETGLIVNGVSIGANENLCLEVTTKAQADPKHPDTHDGIIKRALVHADVISLKLFNQLKKSPDQGPAALVLTTVTTMKNIHPRRSEMKKIDTSAAKPTKVANRKVSTDVKFSRLCHFPEEKKEEMGKVYLESIRYSLNQMLAIYDGIVAPFLATLINTNEQTKGAPRTMNVFGNILALDEGSADREALITSFEETGDKGNHVEYCLHLEEELATARGSAAELEEKCRELTAREHTRILNMVQSTNGNQPVKIPTGYQARERTTILKRTLPGPKKPCFAEARKSNSCTYGDACKYSHDFRDLEKLRKDPNAIRSLNVLDEIMEDIPSTYGAAADAYSEQYQN